MKKKISLRLTFLAICVAFHVFAGGAKAENASNFSWKLDDQTLTLFDSDQKVLTYNFAFMDHANVPANEPRKFAGSYIYPLFGLDGENLTDDAPKDHYHHHGVFWTWPGVYLYEKDGTVKQYDLWTSNTQIRQRFIRFKETSCEGNVATFTVENGWFVGENATTPDEKLDASKKGVAIGENKALYGRKVMSELVTVVARPVENFEGVESRAVDVEIVLTPVDVPVGLQGAEHKSYGGLTIRFNAKGKIGVDKFITTDEGVAKDDMPEKNLRWADYASRFGAPNDELSGAAIFLAPSFPDFPPTWLTRYYGPLCTGFPGVETQKFEPNKPIVMRARIWIHKGLVPLETLQKAYERWANEEKQR